MSDIDTNTKSFINLASKSTDPSNDLLKTNNGGVSVNTESYGNATPEYVQAHNTPSSISNDEYNSRVGDKSINPMPPESVKRPLDYVQGERDTAAGSIQDMYNKSMESNMPKEGSMEWMKIKAFNDIVRSGKLPSADNFRPKDFGIDPKSINSEEHKKLNELISAINDDDYNKYSKIEKDLDITNGDKLDDSNKDKGNEFDVLEKIDSAINPVNDEWNDYAKTFTGKKEEDNAPALTEKFSNIKEMMGTQNPDWEKINSLASDTAEELKKSGNDPEARKELNDLYKQIPEKYLTSSNVGWKTVYKSKSSFGKILNDVLSQTGEEGKSPVVNVSGQKNADGKELFLGTSNKARKILTGMAKKLRPGLSKEALTAYQKLSLMDKAGVYTELPDDDKQELSSLTSEEFDNLSPDSKHYMRVILGENQKYDEREIALITKEAQKINKDITEDDVANEYYPSLIEEENEYGKAYAVDENGKRIDAFVADENYGGDEENQGTGDENKGNEEAAQNPDKTEGKRPGGTGKTSGGIGQGNGGFGVQGSGGSVRGRNPLNDFVNHIRKQGKSVPGEMKSKLGSYVPGNAKKNLMSFDTLNMNTSSNDPGIGIMGTGVKGTAAGGSVSVAKGGGAVHPSSASYKDTKIPEFNKNAPAGGEKLEMPKDTTFNFGASLLDFKNLTLKPKKLKIKNPKRKPLKGEFPVLSEAVSYKNESADENTKNANERVIIKGGLYTSSDGKTDSDVYSKILDFIVNDYKKWEKKDDNYIFHLPSLHTDIVYDGVSQPKLATDMNYSAAKRTTLNLSTVLRKPNGKELLQSIYSDIKKGE